MITFETAVELKKLGFPQNTTYGWCVYNTYENEIQGTPYSLLQAKESHNKNTILVAAPTFDEILKVYVETNLQSYNCFEFDKMGVYFITGNAKNPRQNMITEYIQDYNITEAAAKLWINLKQNYEDLI